MSGPASSAAAVLAALLVAGCAPRATVRPGDSKQATVFGYHGEADLVVLLGDMTGWRAVPLAQRGGGWRLDLTLAPGRYEYRLEVRRGAVAVPALPPGAERADDGYGGENAVLRVGR